MNINDKIRHEKLQYDINSATTKIFALPSSKIDKHEYITRKKYCLHDGIRQKKTSNSLIHLLERHSENKKRPLQSRG